MADPSINSQSEVTIHLIYPSTDGFDKNEFNLQTRTDDTVWGPCLTSATFGHFENRLNLSQRRSYPAFGHLFHAQWDRYKLTALKRSF